VAALWLEKKKALAKKADERIKREEEERNRKEGEFARIKKELEERPRRELEERLKREQELANKGSATKPTNTRQQSLAPPPWVMLSYEWGSKPLALYLNTKLKAQGYTTWIDEERMSSYKNMFIGMADGVKQAAVVVMLVSSKYEVSENCEREYCYAAEQKKPVVMLIAEENFECSNQLSLIRAGALYINARHQHEWDSATTQLVTRLEARNVPRAWQP